MASRTEGTSARRSRRKRQAARSGSYRRNGRWSRFPGPWKAAETNERLEQWARLLLRRYGIVFREVLTRESAAPSWRELRPVYQRLEARREVFGGRFVSGVGGEQFADRQAVTLLRRMRDESADNDRWVVISACDPANLVGIVSDEPRVPAVATHRLALRGGHLIAARLGDSTEFYEELDNAEQEAIRFALQVSGTVRCAMQAGRHVSPLVEQVASATTSTN